MLNGAAADMGFSCPMMDFDVVFLDEMVRNRVGDIPRPLIRTDFVDDHIFDR